jgi:hypothetical protein
MIVIKIELWPCGDREKFREIGRTYISNVGGSVERGNYEVKVCKRTENFDNLPIEEQIFKGKGILRTGEVNDYPRLSYNVWRLIVRALKSAFPEEK